MVYAALGDGRRLLKDCNAVAVLYSLLKKEQSGTRLAERTGLRKCEDFFDGGMFDVFVGCDATLARRDIGSDFSQQRTFQRHSRNILNSKLFKALLL